MNTLQKGSCLCQGKRTFAWKRNVLSSNTLLATVLLRVKSELYYGQGTDFAVIHYLRPSRLRLKPSRRGFAGMPQESRHGAGISLEIETLICDEGYHCADCGRHGAGISLESRNYSPC